MNSNANSVKAIEKRNYEGKVSWKWTYSILVFRTIFFLLFGLLIMYLLNLKGFEGNKSVVPWWPYQVIFTNLISLGLLYYVTRKEGIAYKDLINYKSNKSPKAVLKLILYVLVGWFIGVIGLIGGSILVYQSPPPDIMSQPLHLWAAIIALITLPITSALTETVIYMGYCLPRLEVILKKRVYAIILVTFWLSFQHVVVPINLEYKFMLWRFISFIPLALIIAITYIKTKKLASIMFVHFLLNFQAMIMIVIASLK